MDHARDKGDGTQKTPYGKWLALAAAAAGATAATIVIVCKRNSPATQLGRILDRCDSAACELLKRLAA